MGDSGIHKRTMYHLKEHKRDNTNQCTSVRNNISIVLSWWNTVWSSIPGEGGRDNRSDDASDRRVNRESASIVQWNSINPVTNESPMGKISGLSNGVAILEFASRRVVEVVMATVEGVVQLILEVTSTYFTTIHFVSSITFSPTCPFKLTECHSKRSPGLSTCIIVTSLLRNDMYYKWERNIIFSSQVYLLVSSIFFLAWF